MPAIFPLKNISLFQFQVVTEYSVPEAGAALNISDDGKSSHWEGTTWLALPLHGGCALEHILLESAHTLVS